MLSNRLSLFVALQKKGLFFFSFHGLYSQASASDVIRHHQSFKKVSGDFLNTDWTFYHFTLISVGWRTHLFFFFCLHLHQDPISPFFATGYNFCHMFLFMGGSLFNCKLQSLVVVLVFHYLKRNTHLVVFFFPSMHFSRVRLNWLIVFSKDMQSTCYHLSYKFYKKNFFCCIHIYI